MTLAREVWEGLTEGERERLRPTLIRRREAKRAHPLAFARLWHRERPRTSQRRNTAKMMRGLYRYRFELGGNRSGKSEGGAQRDVVYALGCDHPDVQSWAKRNGVDLSDVPEGPGEVWAVALTSGDSKRYVRPAVERYLPAGSVWRNRDGDGEAVVVLPNGGVIRFKSADQGRRAFQGSRVRRVRFDEEPDVPGVVSEAAMRIVDEDGHIEFTMTPLSGWTALLEHYVREPAENVYVGHLHGEDNPHVPSDVLREILGGYGAHEREARARGEIVALEGRVYTAWRRDLHLRAPEDLGLEVVDGEAVFPDDWPRYAAVDFGTRNPTAIGWFALDPRDDVLHLYRGHYESERPQEWHVRRFHELSGDERHAEGCQRMASGELLPDKECTCQGEGALEWARGPERQQIRWVVADPSGKAERMTWALADVATRPALKRPGSVREQINAVAVRLEPDVEGRPHLIVHDVSSLQQLTREIESYVWDTTRSRGDPKDAPLKKNDHFMDLLGYCCLMLSRTG